MHPVSEYPLPTRYRLRAHTLAFKNKVHHAIADHTFQKLSFEPSSH